jgi:tetratricopeptide (TPR) repeat protein
MSLLELVAGTTGLLTRVGNSVQWEFDHDLTREAILEHLGDVARDLHHDLARLLVEDGKAPPIEVAQHFAAAQAFRAAATSYAEASRRAAEQLAFEDAVAAAQRRDAMLAADGSPPGSVERIEASKELARLLVSAQRYPEAVDLLERLIGMGAGDARVLHALGRAKFTLPDSKSHEDAVALLRAAVQLPETAEDPRIAFDLWLELVFAHHAVGNLQGARAAFRRASSAALAAGDSRLQLRVMRLTCIFWQPDKVVEVTKQALALARSGGHRFEEALCLNNLGNQSFYLNDLEGCAGALRRGGPDTALLWRLPKGRAAEQHGPDHGREGSP